MEVKDCINFLIKEGYLLVSSGKYIITNKLVKEVDPSLITIMGEEEDENPLIQKSNKELYKHFIKEAKVPFRLPLGNGGSYTVSAYSKPGEKAFIRALKTAKFKDLVEATKLYYKSRISNKVTIGNYFSQGIWESEWERYVEKQQSGTDPNKDAFNYDV